MARNLRRGLKCKRRQVDLDAQARSRMSRRSMKVDVVVEWLLGFRSYRIVCITNRGGGGTPITPDRIYTSCWETEHPAGVTFVHVYDV